MIGGLADPRIYESKLVYNSVMTIYDSILKPTLLLDETTARANIRRMAEKAHTSGTAFRPHFKTHQSAEIGEWFRTEGVTAITVSSLDMAEYFAAHGWEDITLAFSVNLRQAAGLDALARRVRLGLLVESIESVNRLGNTLAAPVDLWIKVDSGAGRTGVDWQDADTAAAIAERVQSFLHLRLRGLLTHAGHTYTAGSAAQAARLFHESVARMDSLRRTPELARFSPLLVSVGDTPGCSAVKDFHPADEIRPGNFVFYDAEQYLFGACAWEQIAVALACPVVALHPERGEAVIYGGAIHLSKDFYEQDGQRIYGLVCLPEPDAALAPYWGPPLPGARVDRVSQEHGVLRMPPEAFDRIHIGDLLCILPAHSCLTAQCMGSYLALDGRRVEMMR
jgi:D-serine deaminase-like pyridoxal phosphate-dependent protein